MPCRAELNRLFRYEPESGFLYWKVPRSNVKAGDLVGCKFKGNGLIYWCVRAGGRLHPAHRVIWTMHNGRIPDGMHVDHIDHITLNNRIENLRVVSAVENGRNLSLQRRRAGGFTGVRYMKQNQKWRARIVVNRRDIHLGMFNDQKDAIVARKAANVLYGFHPNHGQPQLSL